MRFFLLLIIFSTLAPLTSFSQDSQGDSVASRETFSIHYGHKTKQQIELSLLARSFIIKLKTHPKIDFSKEEYEAYSGIMNAFQKKNGYQIKDSMTITLTSGISWNMEGPLPQQPKHFLLKMLSKRGRQKEEVQEYLKYLAFVNTWKEEGEIPYEMVEKFNRHYVVISEGKKYIEMFYALKFKNRNSTAITEREIMLIDL